MTSLLPSRGKDLTAPLADVAAWTRFFLGAEVPVLHETAASLEAMRANEDNMDASVIGEVIAGDPLMTLKVFAYESEHRAKRLLTSAETVTSALVMMGISPFFRAFGPQPCVEDWLAERPEALAGLRAVLKRAHRGANFALAFAVHRTDPQAAVIHAATLLHEFAETLVWCHAPALALEIQRAQAADASLRSSVAQRSILHVDLGELQRALTAAWHLPALIGEVAASGHASRGSSARTVVLATRLARHTAQGWDNAAIPDDVAEISGLLNLSPAATLSLLREI